MPRQPLLSDPLSPPNGPIQGLAWFFSSFYRDEWGNVGNELLEAVHGQLLRIQGKLVQPSGLVYNRNLVNESNFPEPLNVQYHRRVRTPVS